MSELLLKSVEEAAKRIAPLVWTTPLLASKNLEKQLGWKAPVFVKCETLQYTGSFKVRGACNKVLKMNEEGVKPSMIVASSAGNHAQAVAYVASKLKIPATIVMPEGAPLVKINSTENYGAKVVLHGSLYDHAYEKAWEIHQDLENSVFVHPYADLDVIAGQGTAGLEIHKQLGEYAVHDTDVQCVIPIGGGGLFSGVACALKSLRAQSTCFGVVADAAPAMALSYQQGSIVEAQSRSRTLADGLAIKKVSPLNFDLVKRLADDVAIVNEEEIARAISFLLAEMKLVVEGAGAAGVAATLSQKYQLDPQKVLVLVLCGGNIDMQRTSNIIERAMTSEGRWVYFEIAIEDKPGELARVTHLLSEERANVLEVEHDRISNSSKPGQTLLKLHLECRGEDHVSKIISELEKNSYRVLRR